jgi:tetratricopeptide (TPR) repeat protein
MRCRIMQIAVAIILVAAALFLPPLIVEACGPDLSPPTFTNYNAPDAPFEVYARGNLGLIEPGYFHVYLYAAYRNLTGKPPSDAEIAVMKNPYAVPASQTAPQQSSTNQPPANWIQRWQDARKQVLGDSAQGTFGYYTEKGVFRTFREKNAYFQYYNCLAGAFENAVNVLDSRVAQFGAQSPYVRDWLAAQDQVFSNCPDSFGYPPRAPGPFIPAAASASDPQIIREDRAYQIAAAHFYSGDFEQARAEFAAIAEDPSSPYRAVAPYLVARVLVREGTLTPGTIDVTVLEQAERQLETVLVDKNLAEIHPAAQGLLDFVRIRLYPKERQEQLESALSGEKPDPNFRQNLIDYLWLLDRSIPANRPQGASQGATQATAPANRGDMTDWILSFQNTGKNAFQYSLTRWRETQSLPWLVAAISQARGSDAGATRLGAAALKVASSSPAYVTVTFHRLRLLAESGQEEQARAGLNKVLDSPASGLTASARNEFLALRMTLATGLQDWLRFAPRVPTEEGWDAPPAQSQPKNPPSYFDADASVILTEKLPLRSLAQAARSTVLPAPLRKQIAIASWTRAILLDNETIAREMTPELAALAPELKERLDAYTSAKNAAARKFAAVFLILHFPAMRPFVNAGEFRVSYNGAEKLADIDPFRDNWWCLMGPPPKSAQWQWNYYAMYTKLSAPLRQIYPDGKVSSPAFLNTSDRAAAAKEWDALGSLPAAPSWLGRETLAWASAHPSDPRVPEALHLVVWATRYGCLDADSGKYSRRAFTLLHKSYPGNQWAKKTPYWFQ